MTDKEDCPKCFGTKKIMKGHNRSKGFKYDDCVFCDENGQVSEDLSEDYSLSLDEDKINSEEYE